MLLGHLAPVCLAVRLEEGLVALEGSAHLERLLHLQVPSVASDHKGSQSTKP